MRSPIRLAAEGDAAAIAALYRPYVERTVVSFETEAPTEDEMGRRIVQTLPSYPWIVCEQSGEVAGYAYASSHRVRAAYAWSVDTAVYVDARCHRLGIGQGLYTSLLAILTAQGYANAYAGITLPNAASVGLHERVGFQPIGVYRSVGYKMGSWHDVGWWHKRLAPHDAEPLPLLDMATVQAHGDWQSLLTRGCQVIRSQPA